MAGFPQHLTSPWAPSLWIIQTPFQTRATTLPSWPGTSVGVSGTQRRKAGCLRPQMGCGGFHGNAHPPAKAPLPALVQGQAAGPAGSGAHPTSNHPPSSRAFAHSVPTPSLLPTMLLLKSSASPPRSHSRHLQPTSHTCKCLPGARLAASAERQTVGGGDGIISSLSPTEFGPGLLTVLIGPLGPPRPAAVSQVQLPAKNNVVVSLSHPANSQSVNSALLPGLPGCGQVLLDLHGVVGGGGY